MSKVKIFADKGRFAVIDQYKRHIGVYALASLAVCSYLFVQFSQYLQFLLVGAGIVSLLYTIPLFTKKRRLRDFAYIKIILIAIVWSYVTESVPLLNSDKFSTPIVLLFIERCLFFIAITIPFDIRDLEIDSINNVATIPSKIGTAQSIILAYILISICMISEISMAVIGVLSWQDAIVLIMTYGLTGLLIHFIGDKENDYYYSGLLDTTIALPYLIHLIIHL